MFRLHGGAVAIDDQRLRASVALGSERTMEQDPTFALRILVDIAIKALSAAINDPTTAVMAIDQLHRMLRVVGLRHLHNDFLRDETSNLRLIFITPKWEDYVHLTCTEIRHCGGGSVQVMRRMRAMLEHLLSPCPSIAMPSCAASSTCSTGRSRTDLPSPKTGRWRGFPIRRAWAGRWGCSR